MLDTANREHPQRAADRANAGRRYRAKPAHAADLGIDAEIAPALGLQKFAGDDCVAAAAKSVADDPIREREAELLFQRARVPATEQRSSVVHEAMCAAHSGKGAMKSRLVAGEQGFPWRRAALAEVPPQSGNLVAYSRFGLEFDNRERVIRIAREIAMIPISQKVIGKPSPVQPRRQRNQASLGAAELSNLGDQYWSRVAQRMWHGQAIS